MLFYGLVLNKHAKYGLITSTITRQCQGVNMLCMDSQEKCNVLENIIFIRF